MSFEVIGKLHKVFEIEAKTATFQTREFVILTSSDNFPQYVKFQLAQDRVNLIDRFKENEDIKVFFDLRGREWQGKYFTNLNAWKIEAGTQPQSAPSDDPYRDIPFEINGDANDGLPF